MRWRLAVIGKEYNDESLRVYVGMDHTGQIFGGVLQPEPAAI
jgi:hypothetical protein